MLDYRKSDALLLPGPSDDIDFLLDLHERCYHAKLDNKIIIDNKRISSPTRLTPDLRARLKQYLWATKRKIQGCEDLFKRRVLLI